MSRCPDWAQGIIALFVGTDGALSRRMTRQHATEIHKAMMAQLYKLGLFAFAVELDSLFKVRWA